MTIVLNSIPWHFTTCPHCAGSGTRVRQHDHRSVRLDCKHCRGFGTFRTSRSENPSTDGRLKNHRS